MAASFSLTSTLRFVPRWVDSLNTTNVIDTTATTDILTLANGSGSGQANAYWRDVVTIAASGTASIDLRSLTLKAFGGTGTLTLASVKAICVRNRSTTASLSVGVSATNRWSGLAAGAITVAGSGCFYATNSTGWATSASDKILAITNDGASAADVEVIVVGVKA